ncbi:L2 [Ailuropoda melanoleuca papillomavirus 1]|uniref:Minor capsid protein L2 n=1 Tax=Ailuropoda melanoleuca papillomavirus 1 TaxID=2016454 RepID=A0A220IGE4_9PAPI|nr:L2 [Ailuropoda melanoleuca papillomavirus 1]ASH99055.1 L2 [Ailuropoda melanoleuca papillomavirus 1]
MAKAKSRQKRSASPPRKRPKRASAEQLYKTCKQAGTCPPDVVNKVEQTTVADQILKWGSLGVFFGGLGISSGSGTGGRTGYVPLARGTGGTSVKANLGIPIRPPQIVEDVITITPELPSVIGGDSSVIGDILETPLITEVVAEGSGNTRINVSSTPDSSIITTHSSNHPTKVGRPDIYQQSSSNFSNPAFEGSSGSGESSFSSHTTVIAGSHIQRGEEIPLQTFPQSSTPLQQATRGATALRRYAKYTQQVPVFQPDFLRAPQRLITYPNPAFDSSIFDASATLEFDSAELPTTAPDPDFLDVVRLHRPAFSTRAGRIRFSRLGIRRGTVTTRRGTNIGGIAHFFQDLSSIAPEELELQTLSPSILEPVSGETSFSNADSMVPTYYDPDSDLQLPSFDHSSSAHTEHSFVRPIGGSIDFSTVQPQGMHPIPTSRTHHTFVPLYPVEPWYPTILSELSSSDFIFHPSLWRKKKRFPFFLSDGIVAA